jgi:hypothetical protein
MITVRPLTMWPHKTDRITLPHAQGVMGQGSRKEQPRGANNSRDRHVLALGRLPSPLRPDGIISYMNQGIT